MKEQNLNYCVILAGGKGRRLWPCSRDQWPKQFIDFFGMGRTLLQYTYDRFARLLPKEIYMWSLMRTTRALFASSCPNLRTSGYSPNLSTAARRQA